MRPEKYPGQHLMEVFSIEKVLTVESVSGLLGNPSKRTVMRKLDALQCRASYSHAGKYYTLDAYADYNKNGLWSFKELIHFSKHGTLLNTILYLISHSEEGYFASELGDLLKVRVHNALAQLHASQQVVRDQIGGEYLYLSPVLQATQWERRYDSLQRQLGGRGETASPAGVLEPLEEPIRFLLSHLNEQQRRLYLGLESMRLGHGGDTRISQITGVNVKTIARGRRELQTQDLPLDRIRRVGAGRPPLKKKRTR